MLFDGAAAQHELAGDLGRGVPSRDKGEHLPLTLAQLGGGGRRPAPGGGGPQRGPCPRRGGCHANHPGDGEGFLDHCGARGITLFPLLEPEFEEGQGQGRAGAHGGCRAPRLAEVIGRGGQAQEGCRPAEVERTRPPGPLPGPRDNHHAGVRQEQPVTLLGQCPVSEVVNRHIDDHGKGGQVAPIPPQVLEVDPLQLCRRLRRPPREGEGVGEPDAKRRVQDSRPGRGPRNGRIGRHLPPGAPQNDRKRRDGRGQESGELGEGCPERAKQFLATAEVAAGDLVVGAAHRGHHVPIAVGRFAAGPDQRGQVRVAPGRVGGEQAIHIPPPVPHRADHRRTMALGQANQILRNGERAWQLRGQLHCGVQGKQRIGERLGRSEPPRPFHFRLGFGPVCCWPAPAVVAHAPGPQHRLLNLIERFGCQGGRDRIDHAHYARVWGAIAHRPHGIGVLFPGTEELVPAPRGRALEGLAGGLGCGDISARPSRRAHLLVHPGAMVQSHLCQE